MIKVTEVKFDFNDDFDWKPSKDYTKRLEKQIKSKVYDCEEDELVDLISDETGYCVQTIDYVLLAECN